VSSPSRPTSRVVTAVSASAPAECLWPQVFFCPHLLLPALAIIVGGPRCPVDDLTSSESRTASLPPLYPPTSFGRPSTRFLTMSSTVSISLRQKRWTVVQSRQRSCVLVARTMNFYAIQKCSSRNVPQAYVFSTFALHCPTNGVAAIQTTYSTRCAFNLLFFSPGLALIL